MPLHVVTQGHAISIELNNEVPFRPAVDRGAAGFIEPPTPFEWRSGEGQIGEDKDERKKEKEFSERSHGGIFLQRKKCSRRCFLDELFRFCWAAACGGLKARRKGRTYRGKRYWTE